MRWQRVARLGVAAAGLMRGGDYFTARGHQKPPPASPRQAGPERRHAGRPTTSSRRERKRTLHAHVRELRDLRGQRRSARKALTTFDDQPFQAWADDFGLNGKSVQADNPAEIHLTGHVKIRSHDGLEPRRTPPPTTTSRASSGAGALHFARERMSGDAIGGHDRDHNPETSTSAIRAGADAQARRDGRDVAHDDAHPTRAARATRPGRAHPPTATRSRARRQ